MKKLATLAILLIVGLSTKAQVALNFTNQGTTDTTVIIESSILRITKQLSDSNSVVYWHDPLFGERNLRAEEELSAILSAADRLILVNNGDILVGVERIAQIKSFGTASATIIGQFEKDLKIFNVAESVDSVRTLINAL